MTNYLINFKQNNIILTSPEDFNSYIELIYQKLKAFLENELIFEEFKDFLVENLVSTTKLFIILIENKKIKKETLNFVYILEVF